MKSTNLQITAFVILLVVVVFALNYYTRAELWDDSQLFQNQHVVNGKVDITILDAESYSYGKSGFRYYIFTDKGRLLVDSKESFLDRTLYNKAKDNLNKTCSAIVDSKIISSNWEIHYLNC